MVTYLIFYILYQHSLVVYFFTHIHLINGYSANGNLHFQVLLSSLLCLFLTLVLALLWFPFLCFCVMICAFAWCLL